jgi:hypothetical protein
MSNYNKIGITRPSAGQAHPFKIDVSKEGKNADGTPKYALAVNYHSRLYDGLDLQDKYLQYKQVEIKKFTEDGIDFKKPVPNSFPGKNFYCVLEINVTNLRAVPPAKILWVESDQSEQELAPVEFQDSSNLRQTKARIIIGVFVSDDEAVAGLPGNESAVNTAYIMQNIHTNLLMCNMVFDGVPIIYPVPFGGGRLNF